MNNTTIEAVKQQQEINYNETANDRIRRQAEEQQNRAYSGIVEDSPIREKMRPLIEQGLKVQAVQRAFEADEADKKQIERERDDNLVAYLEERERRLNAEGQNRMLRQQVREADLARIQQIEYQRRHRDAEFTQDQQAQRLNELSKKNFQALLESRKSFKINRLGK